MADAHDKGLDVARLHSGDPSLYGAVRRADAPVGGARHPLRRDPGSAVFCCGSGGARPRADLAGNRPDRLPDAHRDPLLADAGRARALERLGALRATLAIHLSINNVARVVRELTPHYGSDCPAVVAYRVSWPEEHLIRGTLGTIRGQVKEARITRTALILVGRALAEGRCSR